MQYVWKTIKLFVYLCLILFGASVLTNAIILVFHNLNLTGIQPFINYQLDIISYDTGIAFSLSDILNITFSLIIGLYLLFWSTEALINCVRFFASDNIVLKSRKNNIKRQMSALHAADVVDESDIDFHISAFDKTIKKSEKKPEFKPDIKSDKTEVDKERFAQIIEKSPPSETKIESPVITSNFESSTPPLINVDAADKASKILKDIAVAEKAEENKKLKKEESPKTLIIPKDEEKLPFLVLKDEKTKSEKEESKPAKVEPKRQTNINSSKFEDEFIEHPNLKNLFNYVVNSIKSPKEKRPDDDMQDEKSKKPKAPDGIVHHNIN